MLETVTLGGVNYPCTQIDMVHGSLDFVQGGAMQLQNVSVRVFQADLLTKPSINTIAVFLGVNYRVKSVDVSKTSWHLLLVQEFA